MRGTVAKRLRTEAKTMWDMMSFGPQKMPYRSILKALKRQYHAER